MAALLRLVQKSAILLSIVVLAACGTGGGDLQPDPDPGPGNPGPPDLPPPAISAILTLVNDFRAQSQMCDSGLMPAAPPLAWDGRLELAAQLHSEYMAETGNDSHTGRGGSDPGERALDAGYRWNFIAENIARGLIYETPSEALRGWANSPVHCENLMDRRAEHMGVARAYSTDGVPYWTQVLARPLH